MKILSGLLVLISGLFTGDSSLKLQSSSQLNAAIISFHETYFAPAVAEPGNFPWAKKTATLTKPEKIAQPNTLAPVTSIPSPSTPAIKNTLDPYIPPNVAFIDQSTRWLKLDFSLNGKIYDNAEHSLSNITMNREYWKVDVFTYWAPGVIPPRPPLEKDYFKLEIYDTDTNALIYTMTSKEEENIHKSQIFKKAGKYTFKAFAKTNGQYEITFFVSPVLAKQN